MRVITYNVHQGLDRDSRPMAGALAEAIATRQPDIVTCQEVLADGAARHPGIAVQIADALQRHGRAIWRFAPNTSDARGVLGNAIVVRRGLRDHRNVDLSVRWTEPRGLQTAWIEPLGVGVWNTHFGLWAYQRRRQWRWLREHLQREVAERPLLLCGDFNSIAGGLDRAARHAGFGNALDRLPRRSRRTFPSHRPLLALDRIYHRGLRLIDVRVLVGSPWDRLSDHLPVEADFAPLAAEDVR